MEQNDRTGYHIDQFLEQGRYLRGWSPKTSRTYAQNLGTLHTALNGAPVSKPTLQDFVVWMRQRGLTLGGCNVRIRAVNSFLTWLHEEGHTPERLRVRVLRTERKTPLTVSVSDIRKLLALRPVCRSAQRAWMLCVLLLDTGLRIDEALGLERKSVDLDNLYLKVLGNRAAMARLERYDRWYPLLLEELHLVAAPDADIVAVGGAVAKHLALRGFQQPFTRIMHYSGQAGLARNAAVVGREDSFQAFSHSLSVDAVLATAEAVLTAARVPAAVRDETLKRLRRGQLTTSHKKLMFSYKSAFDAMRSRVHRDGESELA